MFEFQVFAKTHFEGGGAFPRGGDGGEGGRGVGGLSCTHVAVWRGTEREELVTKERGKEGEERRRGEERRGEKEKGDIHVIFEPVRLEGLLTSPSLLRIKAQQFRDHLLSCINKIKTK